MPAHKSRLSPAPRKPRLPVRSVYLFTDLEGVAGVDDWDPCLQENANSARYVFERSEMQRLLTGEVNACIDGCIDAGVEEVVVNDAHGAGRTILIEELHPKARIIRGKDRPNWTFALERCDCIYHLGMHARSDTPAGTLCHTMCNSIKDYRLNGRPVSEFDLSILLAGHAGLPAPFFAGEMRACQQVRELVPNILTVETKEGMSVLSALHLAPQEVRRRIREKSREGIERANAGEFEPMVCPGPCKMEVQKRAESYKPEDAGPGMEFINRHTMAWYAKDFVSIFDFAVLEKKIPASALITAEAWKRRKRA